jgi:purine nucleoside phosphorylase
VISLRVLVTPEAGPHPLGEETARQLAGPGGTVLGLTAGGVGTLRRELSPAEVHYLRRLLLGLAPGEQLRARPQSDEVVGLVCAGRAAGVAAATAPDEAGAAGAGSAGASLHSVADHVNLTWRSPLGGPNEEGLGERFPATTRLYRPDLAGSLPGVDPVGEVVACPADDRHPTEFEREIVDRHGIRVISTELAPVALLAAHLGYRLVAVVLDQGKDA